jgi:hypothetical protein
MKTYPKLAWPSIGIATIITKSKLRWYNSFFSLDATLALNIRQLRAWPLLNAGFKTFKFILRRPMRFGSMKILLKITPWKPFLQK